MAEQDPFDIPPGTLLRGTKYRVVKRLGAGGMGAVFKAEHTVLNAHTCIKFLHPDFSDRPDFLQRFEREARTLARLDHPNIVKANDFGQTEDGLLFLVMELLNGKDLRRLLNEQRFLRVPDAIAIARDVLEALSHAHRLGIIHRDIKPENILLVERGTKTETKIVDFGIALPTDDPNKLTTPGRFIGTCQYASPEQGYGLPATQRSDIYAVACVLFELIAGRRPFPGPKASDYMVQHMRSPVPRLADIAPVPPELDALVARAMAKNPEERPATASDFSAELGSVLEIARKMEAQSASAETADMLITAVARGLGSNPPPGATILDAAGPTATIGADPGVAPTMLEARASAAQQAPTRIEGAGAAGVALTAPMEQPNFREAPTRTSAPAVQPPRAPNADTVLEGQQASRAPISAPMTAPRATKGNPLLIVLAVVFTVMIVGSILAVVFLR